MTLHPLNRLLASLALAAAAAAPVAAAPVYLIDLTTDAQLPAADLANVAFSLTYEDVNLDQTFSLDELLAFTGYTDPQSNTYFAELLAVPTLSGINGTGPEWVFGDGFGAELRAAADLFTPTTSGPVGDTTGVVPEPASLALVMAALAGGLGVRRSRVSARA